MRRLIVVSCLIALSATACGKSGSNQGLTRLNETGFIAQAATQSLAEKTAKIEMVETISPPTGVGSPLTLRATGVMDIAHKLVEFRFVLPAITGTSGSIEMIMSGRTMYMQLPVAFRSQMGVAKPWLGTTIDKLTASSPLGTSSFTDPGSVLEALRSVASTVTKAGDVTIRGVKTTKYVVTLDKSKLAASLPAAERASISALSFDHVNVYVSDDNLVRRQEFAISMGVASFSIAIDMFDYGTPVHVSVPPASQVEFKSLKTLAGQ